MLKVTHGGGLTSLLRSRGDDELVGTWKDRDGNTGAEIWQREPRPHVDRVRCRYLDGAFVEAGDRPCPVVVRSYPEPDSMRGNLPSMTFDVFGTDMRGAGPLPVVLDWDKTRMEVGSYCYLYEKPFAEGEDHGCASWGDPHETYGKIIGIRVKINVTYGATSGVKTFSIGGVPVSFEARLPPVKILSLGFTEPDSPYSPIGDIAFGERFRVRLAFSRDPGHDSEPVSLSTDDPAATIAIDALRTDDRSVYLSEPVLLLEPQTGEVAQ